MSRNLLRDLETTAIFQVCGDPGGGECMVPELYGVGVEAEGEPEYLFERRVVCAETAAGRFDHLVARDPAPVEFPPAVEAQLADEFALGAAVAFAEWVDGVDLAKIVCSPFDKASEGETMEVRFRRQLGERACGAGGDVLVEGEWIAGFRDVDGAESAGPGKDILEDVAVDCLEMAGVEGAGYRPVLKLDEPPGCRSRLSPA